MHFTHVHGFKLLLLPYVLATWFNLHQTAINTCEPQILTTLSLCKCCRIFCGMFIVFYSMATRRHSGDAATHATHLFQDEPLKAAHAHESTLCVPCCAFSFGIHFRVLPRCVTSTMIYLTLRTRVSHTTLCVTFGVHRGWVLLGLLVRLLASLGAKAVQDFRNNSGWWPFRVPILRGVYN